MLKNSHKYVYIVITIVKLALCKEERPIGLSRGRSVMQKRCAWGEKAEGILLLIYVQNKGRLEQILIVRSGLEKGERSKVCQQTHIGIAQYVLISIYPIKCVWSTPCLWETVHDLLSLGLIAEPAVESTSESFRGTVVDCSCMAMDSHDNWQGELVCRNKSKGDVDLKEHVLERKRLLVWWRHGFPS
jgi:hypothetical protein